jgi:phosphoribosylformylglycinamidine synthase
VTGGNVSFYNQTGATAIHPTPVVGVLGVMDDVARRVPSGFTGDGDVLLLLGETDDELDGSEWAWATHRHLGGRPPRARLEAEAALARTLRACADDELLTGAHDLSDGGLAQTLVESALLRGIGAEVTVSGDPFVHLFSESTARALLTCRDACVDGVLEAAAEHDVPVARVGRTGGDALRLTGLFELSLTELRVAHSATLPQLFG